MTGAAPDRVGPLAERLQRLLDRLPRDTALAGRAAGLHRDLTRPVRLVVGGEFSSGKSSLAQMLLGHGYFETKASASAMPTVHFVHGAPPGFELIADGTTHPVDDPLALGEYEMRVAEKLIARLDLPVLKRFELFDTPGTSDPNRDADQILAVAEAADIMIWCTNATQAWRESERRMWETLQAHGGCRGLLAVTHADLDSVAAALDRLMKRIAREAGDSFERIIAMDIPGATAARTGDLRVSDPARWEASGGRALLDAIATLSETIRAEAAEQARAFLSEADTGAEDASEPRDMAETRTAPEAPSERVAEAGAQADVTEPPAPADGPSGDADRVEASPTGTGFLEHWPQESARLVSTTTTGRMQESRARLSMYLTALGSDPGAEIAAPEPVLAEIAARASEAAGHLDRLDADAGAEANARLIDAIAHQLHREFAAMLPPPSP